MPNPFPELDDAETRRHSNSTRRETIMSLVEMLLRSDDQVSGLQIWNSPRILY
jgi:hypothetical protein